MKIEIYQKRMKGYYPAIITSIAEIKAILEVEYPEFSELEIAKNKIVEEAYLFTMSETRIEQWEKMLSIQPLKSSTLEDRRETIIARLLASGKLNTSMIDSVVKVFTGGTSNSWVENSTLFVEINPPRGNKQYQFPNVEAELKRRVPAHLGFQVSRNYYTWGDINEGFSDWNEMEGELTIWEDVLFFQPFSENV